MSARTVCIAASLLLATSAFGADWKGHDIFDHAGQKKAGKDVKKIVFIAGTEPHGGRGNHEFMAAAIFLARTLNEDYPQAWATVYSRARFPKDLSFADSIIIGMDHGGKVADSPEVQKAMKRGAGFMALHYGVEVNKGAQVKKFLAWMGGAFEPFWSVNPWWTPEFKDIPKHATTRGVKPIKVNDEWYYHMRFVEGMKGVTPILYAVPPLKTVGGGGKKSMSHGGNPAAYAAVKAGKAQVMAWAYERPEGGRGFGFTGMHRHDNWGDEGFRQLLANAAAWVSGLEVPATGVPTRKLDRKAREALIDEGKEAVKKKGI